MWPWKETISWQGSEGDPVVRTPVLDWLAETGVAFSNAYTPSPICVPARQCMAVGQLPRTCGVEIYGQDLPPNSPTFARLFSQYAYATVACGKLHHMGLDQMQGWIRRITMEDQVSWEHIPDIKKAEFARYPYEGHKWSDFEEIRRAGPGRTPYADWDDYAIDGACTFVNHYFNSPYHDQQQRNRPIMLYLGMTDPHYPYFADEEKFGYYLNRVQPFLNEEPFDHPFLCKAPFVPTEVRVGRDVDERQVRRATAAYYAKVENNDLRFRRVLDTLEYVGENLDEWIIIYTTDHGEMLGEHSIWEKQKFFDGSVRVPLIIRYPKRFAGGTVVDKNVNLCDLYATLCELAGIPVPADTAMDSRCLVPLMKGCTDGWNNESVSQWSGRNLMIQQDLLRYQYYGQEMPEVLFDLQKNPAETVNFIDAPAYAGAVKVFRARRAELGFGPDAEKNYKNAGY